MCRICDLLSEDLSAEPGRRAFRAELWNKTLHLQSGRDTIALLGYFLAQTLESAPEEFDKEELMSVFRDGMQTGKDHHQRMKKVAEKLGPLLPTDRFVMVQENPDGTLSLDDPKRPVVPPSELN